MANVRTEEREITKKQLTTTPICGICRRPKVKRLGFGGDYECPYCSQSAGIGFGK